MKKADEIINGLLGNYNIELGNTYSSFFQSWSELAGSEIASHSKVRDIENGVLVVEVDHSGWLQIITMKKKGIIKSVNRKYPDLNITDMRIYLG